MAGLLGLGGFGMGQTAPKSLLGEFYDPAEMQRQQIKQMLIGAGLGLMSDGTIAGAGKGAIQYGSNAQDNYMQQAMLGYKMNQAEQDRAYQNEEREWKDKQRAREEKQWQAQDSLVQSYSDPLYQAYPEMAAQAEFKKRFSEGPTPTDDMREYDYARQQGYEGTFQDYITSMKKAGATSVNVNGDAKLTEGQSKDINYYSRGIYADADLSQNEQAMLSVADRAAGGLGVVGNYFKDPKFRQAERAGREFLAVVLRKDTGAAITSEEFGMYGPMYLPMPGDDKQTIEDKRVARKRVMQAIRMGGGTARPLFDQIDQEFQTVNPPAPGQPLTGQTSTGVPWSIE